MKKRNRLTITVVAVALVITIGFFASIGALKAASTETSAFVVVAYSSKDYEQNTIIVNLYVTYAGPTVSADEGIEEMIIEVVPGDSVIVVAQKMTAVVLERAAALGHPMAKGNIVLPAYQKGQ